MSAAAALAASPSVGELTTDVNCTVEHLKELGKGCSKVVQKLNPSSYLVSCPDPNHGHESK